MAKPDDDEDDDTLILPDDIDKVSLARWMVRMEMRMKNVQRDVTGIRSIGKWFASAVGGALILAVMAFITNGGLNAG